MSMVVKRMNTLNVNICPNKNILPEEKTFEGQDVIGGVHQFNLCFIFGVVDLVKQN